MERFKKVRHCRESYYSAVREIRPECPTRRSQAIWRKILTDRVDDYDMTLYFLKDSFKSLIRFFV